MDSRHAQVKIKNPRDLFSIVPYALGYQPEESILVIAIQQAGGLGMMARSSLADLADNDCCIELANMVARNAIDGGTARAFVVVYCTATDEFTLHSYKRQARNFSKALAAIPCETWIINTEKYFRVDCENDACCPKEGFPISELDNTEASTSLVFRGFAPAKTREEYLRLPDPQSGEIAAARLAAKSFGLEKRSYSGAKTWRQKAFDGWRQALELADAGELIPPETLGLLGAALTDTTMRDAVLLSCVPDGLNSALALIEKANSGSAGELLTRVVGGEDDENVTPISPNHSQVRAAAGVLEAVVTHASRSNQPGPLTLLAFLAWWVGDGTRATARVRKALEIQPNYPLAATLATALENHMQPGWIRYRRQRKVASAAA